MYYDYVLDIGTISIIFLNNTLLYTFITLKSIYIYLDSSSCSSYPLRMFATNMAIFPLLTSAILKSSVDIEIVNPGNSTPCAFLQPFPA